MIHLALAGFGLLAATASGATADSSKTGDKNRIVCAKEPLTGSRLGAKKRCMSVQEWSENRRLDRQTAEQLQMNRYNGNESSGGLILRDAGRSN